MTSYQGGSKVDPSDQGTEIPPEALQEINKEFSSAKKHKVKLGRQLNYQRNVVNHFSTAVISGKPEKSNDVKKELVKLRKVGAGESGAKLLKTANNLEDKKECLNALLFYQLASDAFENEHSFKGMKKCIFGMMSTFRIMIQEKDERYLSKSLFLPMFDHLRMKIRGMSAIDRKDRIILEMWCLFSTANVHFHLDEFDESEKACRNGLQILKSKLYVRYIKKHQIYSSFLFMLGAAIYLLPTTRENFRRHTEASEYLSQALTYHRIADDYDLPKHKQMCIRVTEDLLKNVQTAIRNITQ